MGRVYVEYLPLGADNDREYDENDVDEELAEDAEDDEDFSPFIFVCGGCKAHLTRGTELVSKDFTGRSGRAFLFNSVINTSSGVPEDRMLRTGMHTIADIFCFDCAKPLGWKYLHAFDERQRYKVGKVILEAAYISKLENGRPKQPSRLASSSGDSIMSAS